MYINVYLKRNYNARFIISDRYICFKRTYFSKTDLNTQKPLDRSMDLKVTKGQVEKDPLPHLGKGLGT